MRRPSSARDSAPGSDCATDTLFAGRLALLQPRSGYRVNVDTLLLAHFAVRARPKARRVVDLGAGIGALALAYRFLGHAAWVDLVERDPELARLSARNLAHAGAAGVPHVADLERDGLPAVLRGTADVVLSNPPFFPEASGTTARATKRSARTGPLAPFLTAASTALGRRGYAYFAYPASALAEFLDAARTAHLVAKRLRFVHAFAASAARIVLVELRRAKPGGLVVDPPFVEWAAPRVRSAEARALVEGAASPDVPSGH